MQVGAVGAVAGDGDGDGVGAVGEGHGAGAGIVEAADRERNVGRLGGVDDAVGGGGDRERGGLAGVGVERDRVAGGAGRVAVGVGERQRGADRAVGERMQVGAVGAVAGDGDGDGVGAVGEGHGAGAGIVEAADRERNVGRLGGVDDAVGGGGDRERGGLAGVGVERDRVAGGAGRVAVGVGERQRGADRAVGERMQVGAVGAVAGDGDGDGVGAVGEGHGAGAGIVEAADRERNVGRLGGVDDAVGGGGDRERGGLAGVGVERDRVAGGAGRVAVGVGERQRGADRAVGERMQVGAVGAVAGDGDGDGVGAV